MRSILFTLCVTLCCASFAQKNIDPLKLARDLKEKGQFKEALKEVCYLIEKDSANADYFDFRGDVFFKLGLVSEAKDDYDKAVSLAPKDPLYYHHRANFLMSMQQPDDAIADNNRALQLVKKDTLKYVLLLNRGECYRMKREFQKAYDDFTSVLQFDSASIAGLNNMANVLGEMGRGKEAIAYLQKVIRLYPREIGGYGNIAFQYMEQGEYAKALEYNNKVLELDGNQPFAYNNRGFVKYKLNDFKGALEDVNHSLQLDPSNSFAYKNRALIFIALKQFNFACDDLKRALAMGFTQMYGDEVQKLSDQHCTRNN